MKRTEHANNSAKLSCDNNKKTITLIKRRMLSLRFLFIVHILIVIIIGELGRLGYLADSRKISPWVQGAQGLLFLIGIIYLLHSIRQTKQILSIDKHQQIDPQAAKNETIHIVLMSVLILIAIISASISNNCFVVSSCLCIAILYFLQKKINRNCCQHEGYQ